MCITHSQPHTRARLARASCVYAFTGMLNARPRPRSAILRVMLTSSTSRFCGLRSRCITPCLWQWASPLMSWYSMLCSQTRGWTWQRRLSSARSRCHVPTVSSWLYRETHAGCEVRCERALMVGFGSGKLGPFPLRSMYFFKSVVRYSKTRYKQGLLFSSTCSTHSNLQPPRMRGAHVVVCASKAGHPPHPASSTSSPIST